MDFLFEVKFCAPLYQLAILLIGITLALLFGKPKAGLFLNFVFCLYWAYIGDRKYILEKGTESDPLFPWMYFGFGLVILLFGLLAFHVRSD